MIAKSRDPLILGLWTQSELNAAVGTMAVGAQPEEDATA